MKRGALLGVLMFSCFFLILGTAGAYENDAINGIQAFSRITVATILFFALDHMRIKYNKREFEKKKALHSGNYCKAHSNKNYNKSLPR